MKAINSQFPSSDDSNSSGNITWTGPCISCLGINPGDSLNTVTTIIANKVCELASPLDLSTLTLQCALDIFDREEPTNRTLTNVLQLLIDNDCGLKTLIDGIQDQIDGISEENLVLDLKCLKQKDSFGNTLPYTNQSVLQSLINEVCDIGSDITTLSTKYTTLKQQVDGLNIPSGDEVIVTTTVSGPKVVSLALKDVAKDYTDYRFLLGTPAQIQTVLSRQTTELNSLMSGVVGWISTPTTEAQSINNLWLLATNFGNRIAANENCCSSGCDDIKVGFLTSFDENTVILKFTSGAGTYIPIGWVDDGSQLTISNTSGTKFIIPITVIINGETEEIDLSSFTKGEILNFNIDLKMKKGSEYCQKCLNKSVTYLNDDCCKITNISGDAVTIVYENTITATT